MDHHDDDHDRGLAFDVAIVLTRRRMLALPDGTDVAGLVGRSSDGSSQPTAAATGTTTANGATSTTTAGGSAAPSSATATDASAGCEEIPEETSGPYPGDGLQRAERSDGERHRTQRHHHQLPLVLGRSRGRTADDQPDAAGRDELLRGARRRSGVPLALRPQRKLFAVLPGVTGENYLRGVQEADANGRVTFTSIFPAAYSGRWPHIHFEVYPSLAEATAAGSLLATSQLALPQDVCEAVYATDGYSQSVRNLAQTSLERDNVFGDDRAEHQLATVAGSVVDGFTAELSVPV